MLFFDILSFALDACDASSDASLCVLALAFFARCGECGECGALLSLETLEACDEALCFLEFFLLRGALFLEGFEFGFFLVEELFVDATPACGSFFFEFGEFSKLLQLFPTGFCLGFELLLFLFELCQLAA